MGLKNLVAFWRGSSSEMFIPPRIWLIIFAHSNNLVCLLIIPVLFMCMIFVKKFSKSKSVSHQMRSLHKCLGLYWHFCYWLIIHSTEVCMILPISKYFWEIMIIRGMRDDEVRQKRRHFLIWCFVTRDWDCNSIHILFLWVSHIEVIYFCNRW